MGHIKDKESHEMRCRRSLHERILRELYPLLEYTAYMRDIYSKLEEQYVHNTLKLIAIGDTVKLTIPAEY